MANEIRITGGLTITKNGLTSTGNASKILSLTGSTSSGEVQVIGTSYEALDIGDCSDLRVIYLQNPSTASYISVAMHAASQSFAVIRPGGFTLLEPSSSFTSYVVKGTVANTSLYRVFTES